MTIYCVDCAYFEDWDLRHHSGACRLANQKDAPMTLRDPEDRLFVTSNHTCGASQQREVKYHLKGPLVFTPDPKAHGHLIFCKLADRPYDDWVSMEASNWRHLFEVIPPEEAP